MTIAEHIEFLSIWFFLVALSDVMVIIASCLKFYIRYVSIGKPVFIVQWWRGFLSIFVPRILLWATIHLIRRLPWGRVEFADSRG